MLYQVIEDGRIVDSYGIPVFYGYGISDDLLHSHDVEVSDGTTTYGKESYILVDKVYPSPVTLRVKFDLKSGNVAVNAYGRIYKNGVAVGTERTNNSVTYVTYSEDIEFSRGDYIELWIKSGTVFEDIFAKNFRIYGDIVEHEFEKFYGLNYNFG